MKTIVLQNETLRLVFHRENGALIGLTAIESDWEILKRPHLGLAFRLLVPLPGRRNNPVCGEKQKTTFVTVTEDHCEATFIWDGVRSEFGGWHDMKLTLNVRMSARQAVYTMNIENRSDYTIENVYCPYLGDVQHPPGEEWFRAFVYQFPTAREWSLWPTFRNLRGYFGVDYPTQFGPLSEEGGGCGTPVVPYVLLRAASQGLYIGVHAASSELVAWHTELRPGYESSIDARVPEEHTIGGKDVATRFAAVHVPYILAGQTSSLTPIAIEAFQGGWQSGVDIYKRWRSRWMETPRLPNWANDVHAWQQFHVNSPEDELRMPFRDLVQIGEDCARYGVKAIQLVGWTTGGQDQGNPSHDPDPRLGTFDELKEAIAKIQALGVKVVLFSKFTWADRATDNFRKHLIRLAVKDPYGDYYHHGGWQYQTATQLLDINTKRLIPMCFLSEEYIKICEQEFKKVLELGADGILFDECMYHVPALLCFDMGHGHRYGAPVYANDRELIKRFGFLAQPKNEEFLFAGQACYDWQFEVYHLSYDRCEDKEYIPLSRYLLPHVPMMTAVKGFNDRNMINQCLMYRSIISYEPYNFKGRLDDFPLTVNYGRQMDGLRNELKEYFWDGEFRHEIGASVNTINGKPHHPYSVFINRDNGKSGVVVVNYEDEGVTVFITLDEGICPKSYRLVDDPRWKSTKAGIVLPPRSAAVVIE